MDTTPSKPITFHHDRLRRRNWVPVTPQMRERMLYVMEELGFGVKRLAAYCGVSYFVIYNATQQKGAHMFQKNFDKVFPKILDLMEAVEIKRKTGVMPGLNSLPKKQNKIFAGSINPTLSEPPPDALANNDNEGVRVPIYKTKPLDEMKKRKPYHRRFAEPAPPKPRGFLSRFMAFLRGE